METGTSPSILRFALFELDVAGGELRKNGRRVPLQPQPLRVLSLLASRPGSLITREELKHQIWDGSIFVDFDQGLNFCVRRIRAALEDDADSPRFIETIPKRGYRFIADVESVATPRPQRAAFLEVQPTAGAAPSAGTVRRRRLPVWLPTMISLALLVVCASVLIRWQHYKSSAPLTERQLTANPEEAPVLAAEISPDGKYLVYADPSGLYVKHVESGETHALSLPEGFNALPDGWYPDSTNLIVSSIPIPSEKSTLWKVSILGGTPQKIIEDGFGASVSPEGQRIAFLRGGPDYDRFGHEVWVMDSSGGNAHRVSEPPDANAVPSGDEKSRGWGTWFTSVVWSPTGKQIAYGSLVLGSKQAVASVQAQSALNHEPPRTLVSSLNLQPAICWLSDGRIIYSEQEPPAEPSAWSLQVDPDSGEAKARPARLALLGNFWSIGATSDARKLTLLRADSTFQIFVVDRLRVNQWSPLRRFSLDQHASWPWAWTPDGKAVIFTSDRNGKSEVFKQYIDRPTPELLVTSPGHIRMVRVMPDAASLLYSETTSRFPSGAINLRKYPLSGGQPETLVTEIGINNFQCARLPSTICVFDQSIGKTQTLFAYDTITATRRALTKVTDAPYGADWDLSPDGGRVAIMLPEGPIRFYELATGLSHDVVVGGWKGLHTINWSPDSKTVIVAVAAADGTSVLLQVDLRGNAHQLLAAPRNIPIIWSVPSPDGRHQAVMATVGQNNVWIAQHF